MKPISFENHQATARVLVVDDSVDNYVLIQAILKDEGYEISFAESGLEALAKVEAYPPDLVLLDVMMPQMDGFEVAQRIYQNPSLPFIPILLITAYDQPSVARGLNVGADDFIRKPVEPDELIARVRSLLRLKFTINERDRIAKQREDFVSRLTHDLRTPLVAADRVLNLLEQGVLGEMPETAHEAITTMIRSNQNMLDMVNTLLDVYRYEAGRKPLALMPVDLWELIQEVIQELSPLAVTKGLSLEKHLHLPSAQGAGNNAQINGDYLELHRVITNIVGNAIKFTHQGTVQVRLGFLPELELNESPSRWAVIEVEDTGPGIPSTEQTLIFEGFRQGSHQYAGTGLGLNLSRRIVEAHQGKIEVKSTVDQGSIFTIYLPAEPQSTRTMPQEISPWERVPEHPLP